MRTKEPAKTPANPPLTNCRYTVLSKFMPNTPVMYAEKPILQASTARAVFAISSSLREVSRRSETCPVKQSKKKTKNKEEPYQFFGTLNLAARILDVGGQCVEVQQVRLQQLLTKLTTFSGHKRLQYRSSCHSLQSRRAWTGFLAPVGRCRAAGGAAGTSGS